MYVWGGVRQKGGVRGGEEALGEAPGAGEGGGALRPLPEGPRQLARAPAAPPGARRGDATGPLTLTTALRPLGPQRELAMARD